MKTIEQKAQRYDEAIERVVNIRTGKCETTFIFTEGLFDYLFPEIKECNEEEVRKAMIDFFKHEREEGVTVLHYGVNIERMIAWLEKQGEPTDTNPSEFELRLNKLLKQFETLPKEELASSLSFYLNVVQNDGTYREEKQGEQNPAERVKPKFQKGDWITNGYDTLEIIEVKPLDYILQSQDGNIVDDTISYVDGVFDSFTIQDAKDGDVLVASDGSIFLFAGVVDCACKYYAALTPDNYFKINKEAKGGYWETSRAVHPATKEQRDTLFAKMKEAGYEWDAEKKKLKKIEDEIEIPFGAKDSELQEATYYIPQGFHAEIDDDKVVIKKGEKPTAWSDGDKKMSRFIGNAITADDSSVYLKNKGIEVIDAHVWLDELKDRVQPQPKQEENKGNFGGVSSNWSEEDEGTLQGIIDEIRANKQDAPDYDIETYDRFLTWLKSLRPQKQWKPSDEQMDALQYVYRNLTPPICDNIGWNSIKTLELMYQELKKLREEKL